MALDKGVGTCSDALSFVSRWQNPPFLADGWVNHTSLALVFSALGLKPYLMVMVLHKSFTSRMFLKMQSMTACSVASFPIMPQYYTAARSMAGNWPLDFQNGQSIHVDVKLASGLLSFEFRHMKARGVPFLSNFSSMVYRWSTNSC